MGSRRHSSGLAAIFFDLDNTLITTRKSDKMACNKGVPKLNGQTLGADSTTNFKYFILTYIRFRFPMELGTVNMLAKSEIYLNWLQLRYHYLSLSPEVIALLNNLHQNYMLGLITNGPSAAQWEKIDKLKLKNMFDIILVSGDLPWEKPQHEIFDEACDFLGVKPGQCIMIGDKLETDILGGIQAKLGGTVWIPINANTQCNNFKPDFIIESVTDLMNILPKNPKAPACRRKKNIISRLMESSPDLDDCNSNSSDGS